MIGRCCDCTHFWDSENVCDCVYGTDEVMIRIDEPRRKTSCLRFNRKPVPKKPLELVLKAKWWDMIASGEKPEEYRDITQHYRSRICAHEKTCEMASVCKANINCHYDSGVPLKHDVVVLRRGYTSTVMRFRIEKVVIGFGRPEWGAEPGVKYYVIKLGKRIV